MAATTERLSMFLYESCSTTDTFGLRLPSALSSASLKRLRPFYRMQTFLLFPAGVLKTLSKRFQLSQLNEQTSKT